MYYDNARFAKKIKVISMFLVFGLVAWALFLGINGIVFASGSAIIAGIGGYVVGQKRADR